MRRCQVAMVLGGAVFASSLAALAQQTAPVLAQAMVPRTGMMDTQHPMPMNERYLKRFPQPA